MGNEWHGEVEIKVVTPPQIKEVWIGESHMYTNAAPVVVSSGDGEGEIVSQSSVIDPPSLSQQWQQSPNPLPPVAQPQENSRAQAFSTQFSKASSASNTSSAVGVVQTVNDFPQPFSEIPVDIPTDLIGTESQREMPILEKSVIDVACPLGNCPDIMKNTQDAVTILPAVNNTMTNAPTQPSQSLTTHVNTSNASNESSPPQTNNHPNSSATAGTT